MNESREHVTFPVETREERQLPNLPVQQNGEPKGAGRAHRWAITDDHFELLRENVIALLDLDLNHYRTQQMERRLTTLLERRGGISWDAYVADLRRNRAELDYFQEYLTINVSSFYRDAQKWDYLHQTILPPILGHRPAAGLDAWSVGCSIGAEAYTLAMLLMEQAPGARHTIWATDIDDRVIGRAKRGGPYYPNEVSEVPNGLLQKYMSTTGERHFSVDQRLISLVNFDRFNLLKDETRRRFDLIMCRNVVIYFTPAAKPGVYRRLARSLKPGGVLFIGSTETIANHQEIGFSYIAPSFYRFSGR